MSSGEQSLSRTIRKTSNKSSAFLISSFLSGKEKIRKLLSLLTLIPADSTASSISHTKETNCLSFLIECALLPIETVLDK